MAVRVGYDWWKVRGYVEEDGVAPVEVVWIVEVFRIFEPGKLADALEFSEEHRRQSGLGVFFGFAVVCDLQTIDAWGFLFQIVV